MGRGDERRLCGSPAAQGKPALVLLRHYTEDAGSTPTGCLIEKGRRDAGRLRSPDVQHRQESIARVALDGNDLLLRPRTADAKALGRITPPLAENKARKVPARFKVVLVHREGQINNAVETAGHIVELDLLVVPVDAPNGLDRKPCRREYRSVYVQVDLGHVLAGTIEESVQADTGEDAFFWWPVGKLKTQFDVRPVDGAMRRPANDAFAADQAMGGKRTCFGRGTPGKAEH